MESEGAKAARDWATGQGAAADDTEWHKELNERIDSAHQMLSNMKTAAAEDQTDLQALEEASLGKEDAEGNVRIDVSAADADLTEGEEDEEGDSVPAPHNSYNTSDAPAELALTVAQGDSVGPLGQNRGERIRGEFGPVTEGSARKPIGREQQQQQDQAREEEQQEQEQPHDSDAHSLAMGLLWWDGQSAAVKNGILKIQALFRGNRCRAMAKIAAQVTAHDHAVCVPLCQEECV